MFEMVYIVTLLKLLGDTVARIVRQRFTGMGGSVRLKVVVGTLRVQVFTLVFIYSFCCICYINEASQEVYLVFDAN